MSTQILAHIKSGVFAVVGTAILAVLGGCASSGDSESKVFPVVVAPQTPAAPATPTQPPATPPPSTTPPPTSSLPPASNEELEADWVLRSEGDGVIWAHDFREPGELQAFLKPGSAAWTSVTAVSSTTGLPPQSPRVIPNAYGQSSAIQIGQYGTMLRTTIPAAAAGTEVVVQIDDGSDFPVAVLSNPATHYWAYVGRTTSDAYNGFYVVDGPTFNGSIWTVRLRHRSTLSEDLTQPRFFSSETLSWEKPMTAFPAGVNGKAAPDRGMQTGQAVATTETWVPSKTNRHVNFRGGYWMHPEESATFVPTGAWQGAAQAVEGSEFWIQYRVKYDAGMFTHPLNTSPKVFYLQTASGSSSQQLYANVGPPKAWLGDLAASGLGSHFNLTTNGQVSGASNVMLPWNQGSGGWLQPGTTYSSCLQATPGSICWRWPANKWVTVLLHVKPGRRNYPNPFVPVALAQELAQVDHATQPEQWVSFVDTSLLPDPAVYQYYAVFRNQQINPATGSAVNTNETVRVMARNGNRLLLKRNIERQNKSYNGTFPVGEELDYGLYYRYDWQNDPNLAPPGHDDTTLTVDVHVDGDPIGYTRIMEINNARWIYGNNSDPGDFSDDPPAFNVFRPTLYSDAAWPHTALMQYTQIILSKKPIPPPQVRK